MSVGSNTALAAREADIEEQHARLDAERRALESQSQALGAELQRARTEAETLLQADRQALAERAGALDAREAKLVAQAQEKNLWQMHGAIDLLILIVLLAAALSAALAAILRVGARRYSGSRRSRGSLARSLARRAQRRSPLAPSGFVDAC